MQAGGPKLVDAAGGELGRLRECVKRENRLRVQRASGHAERHPLILHIIPRPLCVQTDGGAGEVDVAVELSPPGLRKTLNDALELSLLRLGHVGPSSRVTLHDPLLVAT